mmetsp:Transcript_18461/g.50015  ORF Transcript_18461/g.50015 Transcript_18461/m.50015 type:complete len:216 (+) Transcript_18461:1065-1712(+)
MQGCRPLRALSNATNSNATRWKAMTHCRNWNCIHVQKKPTDTCGQSGRGTGMPPSWLSENMKTTLTCLASRLSTVSAPDISLTKLSATLVAQGKGRAAVARQVSLKKMWVKGCSKAAGHGMLGGGGGDSTVTTASNCWMSLTMTAISPATAPGDGMRAVPFFQAKSTASSSSSAPSGSALSGARRSAQQALQSQCSAEANSRHDAAPSACKSPHV